MKLLTVLALTLPVLFSLIAFANTESFEQSCKVKAKEIAAQAYRSCVTENRNAKIDEIRDSYKQELADLKDKYESKLKSLESEIGKPKPAKKASKKRVIEVESEKPAVENEDGSDAESI